MQIEVINVRNAERKQLIENCIKFYARELKITNSRAHLLVKGVTGLDRENGAAAQLVVIVQGLMVLEVDSRLNGRELIDTLAHEMVHVKQHVRGQTRSENRRGRLIRYWMGREVDTRRVHYTDLPWELEAYGKEKILANRLLKAVGMLNNV